MEAVGIIPYETLAVWNVASGCRLETYVIEGEHGAGVICLNGAARLVSPKDLVIIASFVDMPNLEAFNIEPKQVFVDENNSILPTRKEDAGQSNLKKVVW